MFLKKQFALMLSLFNYTDYYIMCLYSMKTSVFVGNVSKSILICDSPLSFRKKEND